jgi:hypothetical protein
MRLIVLFAVAALAACDGAMGPVPPDVPPANRAASLAGSASSLQFRFEVVDQLRLMDSRYDGPVDLIRVAKLDNDNGTFSVLARVQSADADGTALVVHAAGGLRSLLEACRNGSPADVKAVCDAAKDIWFWTHAEEETHGSAGTDAPIGLLVQKSGWAIPVPTPSAALERSEVMPATPVGRSAMTAWCADSQNQAPSFCRQVAELSRPRR